MPTQEQLDQAARDYAMYLSKTDEMKTQVAVLQSQVDTLSGQRTTLNEETGRTGEAVTRLRGELLQIEADIAAAQKTKEEAARTDSTIFEQNRKTLGSETERLTTLANEIENRESQLQGKEKAIAEREMECDALKAKYIDETDHLLAAREECSVAIQRARQANADGERELANARELLRKAEDLDASSKQAQEQIAIERKTVSDTQLDAMSRLNEIKARDEMMTAKTERLEKLIPVAKDFYLSIQAAAGNDDATQQRIKTFFEDVA